MNNLKVLGKTESALVVTGGGFLRGLVVHTDGTNAVTLDVYDNTSAAVPKLISTMTIPTSATNRTTTISFDERVCGFSNGIYLAITCTGTVTVDTYFDLI